MIKYNLICKKCDLTFDSWFASSKEYEKLKKMKLLNCNYCNSLRVTKSLMAPNILNINENIENKKNKEEKKLSFFRKEIKKYQKFIKNNLEYVGKNFAYEARSIHYNNRKKNKGIYGTVSKQDLKELKEEGIDAQIVPWFESENN